MSTREQLQSILGYPPTYGLEQILRDIDVSDPTRLLRKLNLVLSEYNRALRHADKQSRDNGLEIILPGVVRYDER